MMVFWIVVTLLLVGVLLLLLPALWRPKTKATNVTSHDVNLAIYRDQLREAERDLAADTIAPQRFAESKSEIERRVLEVTQAQEAATAQARPAKLTAVALLVLIPLASVMTYLVIGQPEATSKVAAPTSQEDTSQHSITPEQIQKMVATLAEKLKDDPNNAEGWMMLGRSYSVLGRYSDSAMAFKRATELAPGNADLLADYADVMGMMQGRSLAGEPARLIQQALDANPRHVKALALAGTVAFEARDYAGAESYWERLLAVVEPQSDMARSIQGSIAQARQMGSGVAAAPQTTAAQQPTAKAEAVSGGVTISPELTAKVSPSDTVYVFARAAEGPRMPLAILRLPVGTWPLNFSLDDSMAMASGLKISGFAKVVIGARVSKSGNATPQPGDLMGNSEPVSPGAKGVRVTINQIVP